MKHCLYTTGCSVAYNTKLPPHSPIEQFIAGDLSYKHCRTLLPNQLPFTLRGSSYPTVWCVCVSNAGNSQRAKNVKLFDI